jgi:hypothetical protein
MQPPVSAHPMALAEILVPSRFWWHTAFLSFPYLCGHITPISVLMSPFLPGASNLSLVMDSPG